MEIVENWSRIVGTVTEWQPPEEPNGAAIVVICVEDVRTVMNGERSYRNLITKSKGEIVHVQVPYADANDLKPARGMHIELEVRRGRSATKLFARPGTIVVRR